ncbi:MAG: NAD-dependent epimerase/dehydratase family protein [Fimbriimonadaceae bacterium]
MKLFLTGGTGLLGANLIPILLERGHEVVAMARNPDSARKTFAQHAQVRWVPGDLDHIESIEGDVAGVDVLIHAAALFTDYYTSVATWRDFERRNVDATGRLFRIAKRAAVKKGLFVSSIGALADPHNQLQDEQELSDDYRRSKVLGEKRLAADRELDGFPVIIVRPGFMLGPNDPAPTVSGRMARDLVTKGSTLLPKGQPIPVVDPRDVALGIVAAAEQTEGSTYFNFAAWPISADDAFRRIAKHIPGARVKTAPLAMAEIGGRMMALKVKLFGGVNTMPVEGARFLARRLDVDGTKAVRELGLTYRPFEETARDTAEYWVNRVKSGL